MPAEPFIHEYFAQVTFRGYAAWALPRFSAKRELVGKNQVVLWIVDQWLEANQQRLTHYGLSEAHYAQNHAPPDQ